MIKYLVAAIAGLALLTAPAFGQKQKPPDTWDGLVKVNAKKFDVAYLAPGADFKGYTKVMIDPTETAFRKNWQRDYNSTSIGLQNRISDEEARDILKLVQEGFQEVFQQVYIEEGYQIVSQPGADVLRIKTAVFNLDVQGVDQMNSSRTTVITDQAGQAALMIELRDSMSGAILGRAVDSRSIGDTGFMMRRNRVNNRADFERAFRTWAKMSVDGLAVLKNLPPVGAMASAAKSGG